MVKSPSSPVLPKRFFTPRSRRCSPWRSPSRYSTTSTMCSRVRGPAMAPSLVTWPTSTMGTPVSLATVSRRATASRTWLGLPGAPAASVALTVWTESTTASGGRSCVDGRGQGVEVGLGEDGHRGKPAPQPFGAHGHLQRRLLAGAVQDGSLRPAHPRRQLQRQGRLADARVAAEQDERPASRRHHRERGRAHRCRWGSAAR